MCPVVDLLGSLSIITFFSVLQLWDAATHCTPLAPHFAAITGLMHEVLRTPHQVAADAVRAAAPSSKATATGDAAAGVASRDSNSLGMPPGYTAAAAVKALASVSSSCYRVYGSTHGMGDMARARAGRDMQLTADSIYGVLLASAAIHAAQLHAKCSSSSGSSSRRRQQQQQLQHVPQAHHVLVLDQLGKSWLLSEPGNLLLPAYMAQDLHPQVHVTSLQLMFRLRVDNASGVTSLFGVVSISSSSRDSQQQQGSAAPLFKSPAAAAAEVEEPGEREPGPKWFLPSVHAAPAAEAEYAFSGLLLLTELLAVDPNIKPGEGVWHYFAPLVDNAQRAEGSISKVRQNAECLLASFLIYLVPAAAAGMRAAAGSSSSSGRRLTAAAALLEEGGGSMEQLAGLVTNMIMFSEF
jgi:hypothetical protein